MHENCSIELEHEPRNFQVSITEGKDPAQIIEVTDETRAFLSIEIPTEARTTGGGGDTPHKGSETEFDDEDLLRTQVEEAHTRNEELERQVSELSIQLHRAQRRGREQWNHHRSLVSGLDRQLREAEAEIEHLRAGSSGGEPVTPKSSVSGHRVTRVLRTRESISSTVHVPRPRPSISRRRGKAPPPPPRRIL